MATKPLPDWAQVGTEVAILHNVGSFRIQKIVKRTKTQIVLDDGDRWFMGWNSMERWGAGSDRWARSYVIMVTLDDPRLTEAKARQARRAAAAAVESASGKLVSTAKQNKRANLTVETETLIAAAQRVRDLYVMSVEEQAALWTPEA